MSAQPSQLSLILHRLHTHHLLGPKLTSSADAVSYYGAVQAQDLLASLWALGQRVEGATEATVERAIAERRIVRTWPLRGTIHFVTAEDTRWMLNLSAERTIRSAARRHRELGLDDATFARSGEALVGALQGGRRLERHAAYGVLEAAGISTAGQRGIHILGRLALQGLIVIGPREGKQPTFVLLDEWVPAGREWTRDEALAELARRYFSSHGPATLVDFTWWSGLVAAEARAGLEAVKDKLAQNEIAGQVYWSDSPTAALAATAPIAHLLPIYDEYTVAYKDRSAVLAPEYAARSDAGNGIFRAPILIEGRVVGTWTRKLKRNAVVISPNLFRGMTGDEEKALAAAAEQYGVFLGLPAELARAS